MARMIRVKALLAVRCALCGKEFAPNESVYEWVYAGHRIHFCKGCKAHGPRAFIQKEAARILSDAATALRVMETQDPNAIYYPKALRMNIHFWLRQAQRCKFRKAASLKTLWMLEHWIWPVLYHARRAGWL